MPEGWCDRPLASVVERDRRITYGIVQPGGFVDDGIPLVRGGDYSDGWAALTDIKRVRPEIDAPYKRSRLRPGDILMTIVGANTGLTAVVPDWLDGANITQTTARIAVDQKLAAPTYILHWLRSSFGQDEIRKHLKGAAQPGLNLNDVERFIFAAPPLAQQRRIAAVLDIWNDAVEFAEHVVTLCNARERALRERSYADAGGAPAGLDAIFKAVGKINEAAIDHVITVGKYAIRPQSEHFGKSVASKDLSNYNVIEPGQFVYDPMSLYYGAIGRYDGDRAGVVSPVYRVLTLQKRVVSDFVVGLLKTERLRYEFDAQSSQGNNEGKRRGIDREVFFQIPVRLPSEEVQQNVAAVNSAIAAATRAAKARVKLLRRQKRGLMQKLLTGEWRVPDTGDAFVPGGPAADRLEAAA